MSLWGDAELKYLLTCFSMPVFANRKKDTQVNQNTFCNCSFNLIVETTVAITIV